jgi:hypothetical protein
LNSAPKVERNAIKAKFMNPRNRQSAWQYPALIGALAGSLLIATELAAAPAIRMTEANRVPACVTTERLMAFLAGRNERLDGRYRQIANWYKYYGEAWRVRWDYAFYQMLLETNYLKYRREDGSRGDVRETQNNFAGIGATGGGVPGDRFADVKSGVHAQIQHLVAYSGERVADPIAPRTREKQDDIIDQSRRLRRPVTFGDLARRWAADRTYAKSIDVVAGLYNASYCAQAAAADPVPATPMPAVRHTSFNYPPPSKLGGPKERMRLAGPDALPWSDKPVPTNPAPAGEGGAHAQDAPGGAVPKHTSPVRTIWSRENRADDDEKALSTAAAPAEDLAGAAKAPPATTEASAPAADASEGGFQLPKFKIAPIEPSKLGGPVAADTRGRETVAAETSPQALHHLPPNQAPAFPSAPRSAMLQVPQTPRSGAACHVLTASYGGKKTLLLRDASGKDTRYTALTVLDGFEKSMVDTFAKANGISAEVIGEYATKDEALDDARARCPGS